MSKPRLTGFRLFVLRVLLVLSAPVVVPVVIALAFWKEFSSFVVLFWLTLRVEFSSVPALWRGEAP